MFILCEIFFINHINNLLLYHSNEISKYYYLLGNSTCSLIYSIIARKLQGQTNSSNQTAPQQHQNQNMNVIAQALMKVNIFELKDTLMKANLAIIDGNLKEALTSVRDVESQLLEIEPLPTNFLSVLHKVSQSHK